MLQYGIVLVVYYNTLLNVNHSIVFNIIIKELITLLQYNVYHIIYSVLALKLQKKGNNL